MLDTRHTYTSTRCTWTPHPLVGPSRVTWRKEVKLLIKESEGGSERGGVDEEGVTREVDREKGGEERRKMEERVSADRKWGREGVCEWERGGKRERGRKGIEEERRREKEKGKSDRRKGGKRERRKSRERGSTGERNEVEREQRKQEREVWRIFLYLNVVTYCFSLWQNLAKTSCPQNIT